MPTPCEERGWKVGDRFIYRSAEGIRGTFSEWSEIELESDDRSNCPLFGLIEGHCDYDVSYKFESGAFADLDNVVPADEGIGAIAKAMRNLQQQ